MGTNPLPLGPGLRAISLRVEEALPAVLESLGRKVLGSLEMGIIPDHRLLEVLALAALVQTGARAPFELESAFERYADVTGCAVERGA